MQKRLSLKISELPMPRPPRLVGGVDVHLRRDSNTGIAVIAVVSLPALEVVELACEETPVTFPYVPGLLSFRELPPVVNVFRKLGTRPDVLLVDGHGRSHPRRFGLACHLGLELDIPCVGCAKSRLTGTFNDPGPEPGQHTTLTIDGAPTAMVLRTRRGSRPLFVSVGHRIDIDGALSITQATLDGHRLPVPLRTAHNHARKLSRA